MLFKLFKKNSCNHLVHAIILSMNSFRSIFLYAWSCVLCNKKLSFIVFIFQFLPFIVFFGGALLLSLLGYTLLPRHVDFILSHFTSVSWLLVGAGTLLLFVFLCLLFQLACTYFSNKWLSYIFQKKNFTFRSLFSEWKGIWPWAGTGLSVALHFVWLAVVTFILALLAQDFSPKIWLLVLVLGIFVGIFFGVFLSLSLPVYFFEDKKYFQATQKSWEIIHGRWWKTFWYTLISLLFVIIVSFFFNSFDKFVTWVWAGHFLPENLSQSHAFGAFVFCISLIYAVLSSAVSIVLQIFLSAFSFALYLHYNTEIAVPKVSHIRPSKKQLLTKKK